MVKIPSVEHALMLHAIVLKYKPNLKPLAIPPSLANAPKPTVRLLRLESELKCKQHGKTVTMLKGAMLKGMFSFHCKGFARQLGFRFSTNIKNENLTGWIIDTEHPGYDAAHADLSGLCAPYGLEVDTDSFDPGPVPEDPIEAAPQPDIGPPERTTSGRRHRCRPG